MCEGLVKSLQIKALVNKLSARGEQVVKRPQICLPNYGMAAELVTYINYWCIKIQVASMKEHNEIIQK